MIIVLSLGVLVSIADDSVLVGLPGASYMVYFNLMEI
jgi:hypothetical protein